MGLPGLGLLGFGLLGLGLPGLGLSAVAAGCTGPSRSPGLTPSPPSVERSVPAAAQSAQSAQPARPAQSAAAGTGEPAGPRSPAADTALAASIAALGRLGDVTIARYLGAAPLRSAGPVTFWNDATATTARYTVRVVCVGSGHLTVYTGSPGLIDRTLLPAGGAARPAPFSVTETKLRCGGPVVGFAGGAPAPDGSGVAVDIGADAVGSGVAVEVRLTGDQQAVGPTPAPTARRASSRPSMSRR